MLCSNEIAQKPLVELLTPSLQVKFLKVFIRVKVSNIGLFLGFCHSLVKTEPCVQNNQMVAAIILRLLGLDNLVNKRHKELHDTAT